jgi:catechol 2,3-dioxygenase-like lactoylglutathione lyase family enzyme
MAVYALDHLVLTVRDMLATRRFYVDGLGLTEVTFEGGRRALQTGAQKINLHQAGQEFEPKAAIPTPGSGDICLLTSESLTAVADRMAGLGYPVELGPVPRTGATAPLESLYFRDPDGNLVEVARPR